MDQFSEEQDPIDQYYNQIMGGMPYEKLKELEAAPAMQAAAQSPSVMPKRDMLSEAIISFGPALLGGLTGSSGAIAQAPASKQARDFYEGQRKEEGLAITKEREAQQKRVEAMLKAKQAERDGEFKQAALSMKDRDFAARQEENQVRRQDAMTNRERLNFDRQSKLDEKMQGLETPYGLANTVDDAKKLKEAHEAKMGFDSKLQELIDLRGSKGGGAILDREAVARAAQLSKDLLLEYKNIAKLGVLSVSDENILNKIIPPDPLQYNSPLAAVQGQDPILSNLKKFKDSTNQDFQTRVATRTRQGIKDYNTQLSQGPASSFPMQVRKGNQVATVSNADELKEAQQDGWK